MLIFVSNNIIIAKLLFRDRSHIKELSPFLSAVTLRYFVPQVQISGKMMNGYPMFSVKNIVQNVKLIELWGKNSVPLHFVIS